MAKRTGIEYLNTAMYEYGHDLVSKPRIIWCLNLALAYDVTFFERPAHSWHELAYQVVRLGFNIFIDPIAFVAYRHSNRRLASYFAG